MFLPRFQQTRFRNGKDLKDYLVKAALPQIDNVGGFKTCRKGTC